MNARPWPQKNTAAAILLTSLCLAGCSDDGPVGTEEPADLRVRTETTGLDPDPDGYTVSVDGGPGTAIGANESVTFAGVPPGERRVELSGLAAFCAVAGSNPVTVTASAGGTVEAVFSVVCQESLHGSIAIWSVDADGNTDIYTRWLGDPLLAPTTRLTRHPAHDSEPAVSPDGFRIAFVSDRDGDREIYVMNANGSGLTNLTRHPASDSRPRWSPDGARIAFTSDRNADGALDIFVMQADGSGVVNLTGHPAFDNAADWSPDGTRIAFTSNRTGDFEIFVMAADGSDPVNLTRNPDRSDFAPAWSPDGARIAFTRNPGNPVGTGDGEILVMNADGSDPVNLTNHEADDFWPSWSRDGARVSFTSDRRGDFDVFVMNSDGSGPFNAFSRPGSGEFGGFPQAWGP